LERVIAAFARAAKRPKDPATAHDLRVAIRRFQQCLEMFDGLFAPKPAEKLRKRLRKLMDLCGAKRDYDVGLEVLAEAGLPPYHSVTIKFRRRQVSGSRALARRLARKSSRDDGDRWRKQLRLAKRPGGAWDWQADAAESSKAALPGLAAEFFAEGDRALLAYGDHKALHQFRLRTKGFRYSLEVFAPGSGAGWKPLLDALRQLQDRIGAINDCVVVLTLPGMDAIAMHAVRRLLVIHERSFARLWKETFSPRRRKQWIRLLGRPKSLGRAGARVPLTL
jgi:CHAD domain-containing protein